MLTIHAIPGRNIVLGIEGENFARSVIFDISDWISAYGIGTVSMIAQRSRDKEPYPCNITVDGNTAVWSITSADTAHHGYGKCELRYSVGDVLVKSETWRTYTADALGTPAPEAPEPQKAWVDKVLEAGQAAVDASVNSPKVGDNGNWFVWDFGAGKYVDTGVAASGGGSGEVLSVNGKTGAVKLEASDVGAVAAPATASVGQTIVVKAVDEDGRPTEWEATDMSAGTDAKEWDTDPIVDFTVTELSARVVVDVDMNGQPFSLRRAIMRIYQPADTERVSKEFEFGFNKNIDWGKGIRTFPYPATEGQMQVSEVFFDHINNNMYPVTVRASINTYNSSNRLINTASSAGLYMTVTDNGYRFNMYPADCVVLATYGNYIIPGTRVVVWGERE